MTITQDRLSLTITDTTSITVSDIVEDEDTGKFIRVVQFYTDALDAQNRRPVLEVRLSGDTHDDVIVTTPQLTF